MPGTDTSADLSFDPIFPGLSKLDLDKNHLPPIEQIWTHNQVTALLKQRYGNPAEDFRLEESIRTLRSVLDQLTPMALKDKHVLDIACGAAGGSAETGDRFLRSTWAPWLLRSVKLLGGTGVGIDIGINENEAGLEFYRKNLISPEALAFLPSASFDLINCDNFFSSPHLVFNLGQNREQRSALIMPIEAEIKRLLKPNGIILTFNTDVDDW